MKKKFVVVLALFSFSAIFSNAHGMEGEKREGSLSLGDICQKTQREIMFSESFLDNLIDQIKDNNFTTFDVVQETCLKQLSDYIYATYSNDVVLALMEQIETHQKKIETKN